MSRLTVLYVYLAISIFCPQSSFIEASFLNYYADSALTVWTVIGWVLLQTQSCLICWRKKEMYMVTSITTCHLFRQKKIIIKKPSIFSSPTPLTSWVIFQHWIQTEGLVPPCDQDILWVCTSGIVTSQSDRSKQHCVSLCMRNRNLDRQKLWEKRERDQLTCHLQVFITFPVVNFIYLVSYFITLTISYSQRNIFSKLNILELNITKIMIFTI